MTQPPGNILLRIEGLLSAGKQQEARLLLMDYIKQNPASARAWWLMSLTLTDVNQQKDCLQRVLLLDPDNEPARERLTKLNSQPPVSTQINPFTPLSPAETKDLTEAVPPATSPIPQKGAETGTPLPKYLTPQTSSSTTPSVPPEPSEKPPLASKPKRKIGIGFILLAGFAVCIIALVVVYLSNLVKVGGQDFSHQQTLEVAQTLTNLPLPTLIPTWTASPTNTALPSATVTWTPTLTPTPHYTQTKTPRPTDLIGAVEGLYAPDFSLTDLATGKRLTLNQYDGQPVFLLFWTSVCSPCNSEIGSIETISQTYKDPGLAVLTIVAREDYATLTIYRSAHKLTFPILLDPGSLVESAYQVNANTLPVHFFINSSGRIASIKRGEMTLDEMKIQLDGIIPLNPTPTP